MTENPAEGRRPTPIPVTVVSGFLGANFFDNSLGLFSADNWFGGSYLALREFQKDGERKRATIAGAIAVIGIIGAIVIWSSRPGLDEIDEWLGKVREFWNQRLDRLEQLLAEQNYAFDHGASIAAATEVYRHAEAPVA